MNRTCRIEPKTFVSFRKIAEDSGGSTSCNFQSNCRTSFTIATALLSPPFLGHLLCCSSPFQCGNQHSTSNLEELTFGRMPILTRRFGASKFQEVLTRRSIEFLRLTSSSGISFSRSVGGVPFDVAHGGNYIDLPSNTALILSTGNKLLFLFQLPLNPLWLLTTASVSIFSCLTSKFRNRSFWSSLLFIIVFTFWKLDINIFDEFPCHTILIRFWVDQTLVFSICTDSTISSDGIFVIDDKISSHLVSNSWTLLLRRVMDNKPA